MTQIYGVKSAIPIPLTKATAASALIATQIKNLTGIFIVEDTNLVPPKPVADPLSQIVAPLFPVLPVLPILPTIPPPGVVAFDAAAYKRQNLIDTLRPNGIDSQVLIAIKSVMNKTGGVVVGNAAVMVS